MNGCEFGDLTTIPKAINDELRKKFNLNAQKFYKLASFIEGNENFRSLYKEKYGKDLDLNGDAKEIVEAALEIYPKVKADLAATAHMENSSKAIRLGNFPNVQVKQDAITFSVGIMSELDFKYTFLENSSLTRDQYIAKTREIIIAEAKNYYEECLKRNSDIPECGAALQKYLAVDSSTGVPRRKASISAITAIIEKYGTEEDKNMLAFLKEVASANANIFFDEVLSNSNIHTINNKKTEEKIVQEGRSEEVLVSTDKDNTEGQDESNENDTNDEEDIEAEADNEAYDKEGVDHNHLGDYNNFMEHVDGVIVSYFNSLRKFVSSNATTDGKYVVSRNNSIALPEYMNAKECCMMVIRYCDFSSPDALVNSIISISKNIEEYKSFALLADTLINDKNFANLFYATFSKEVISGMMVTSNEEGAVADISNKTADKRLQLNNEYLNSQRTTIIDVDHDYQTAVHNRIFNELDDLKTAIEETQKLDPVKDKDDFEASVTENNTTIQKLTYDIYSALNTYFPTLTEGSIRSYFYDKTVHDKVSDPLAFVNAANDLLSILSSSITGGRTSKKEYNKIQGQLNYAYHKNEEVTKKIKNKTDTEYDVLIDTSEIIAKEWISQSTKSAAQKLSNIMQNYTVVRTDLNSYNVEGNKSSDVINSSMMTNIIKTLQNDVALNHYGEYKFKGVQYNFSNILLEHKDSKGNIINYGLFYKENGEVKQTSYAKDLLRITLFKGAKNESNNRNSTYAKMSDGDYINTAIIEFYNTEKDPTNNFKGDLGTYFVQIPSDAPKTFCITLPKYTTFDIEHSERNLFKKSIGAEERKKINDKKKDYKKLIVDPMEAKYYDASIAMDGTRKFTESSSKEFIDNVYGEFENDQVTTFDRNLVEFNPKAKSNKFEEGSIVHQIKTYKFVNEKGEVRLIHYTIEGKYQKNNNKATINNPKVVEIVWDDTNIDGEYKFNELLEKKIIDDFTKQGIINVAINRNHAVFKQYKQMFASEVINMANAINTIFKTKLVTEVDSEDKTHTYRMLDIDPSTGVPTFNEGFSNDNAEGKLYEIYHYDGKQVIKNGKLTGRVFTSDKFEFFDIISNKRVNLLDDLFRNGVIDIINGGVNNGLHFNIDTNGNIILDFTTAQQEAINNAIEEYINRYSNSKFIEISKYSQFIQEEYSDRDHLVDFILNQNLMLNNFTDFLEGDPKFYVSTDKKKDFLKRAKEIQGSGVPYGFINFTESLDNIKEVNNEFLDENLVKSSQLNNLEIIGSNGKPIRVHTRFNAVTVRNSVMNSEDAKKLKQKLIDQGVNEDIAESMIDKFNHVKGNDAQSYITFEEWVRRMDGRGKLNKYLPLIEAINKKNPDGTWAPIDPNVLTEFIQVQKNFYYDLYYDPIVGMTVPRQIKNAEFVLVPRFIEGTSMEKVYNAMIKHNVSQLNTVETTKASKSKILSIWDNDGKFNQQMFDNFEANLDSHKEQYNYRFLYTQQESPQHMDAENKAGIQIMKKIIDNFPDDYVWKHQFFDSYTANIKRSFRNVMREFNIPLDENGNVILDENGNLNITKSGISGNAAISLFYDRLREEAERLGVDSNALEFLSLNKQEVKDENGNIIASTYVPAMPSYFTNLSTKLESIAQSMFNSRISRQKLPGFHAEQITSVGYDDTLHYHPEVKNEKGEVVEEAYMEVRLPKWMKAFYNQYTKDGKLKQEITIEDLEKAGLDKFIGYRIPTEGKQSICIMKVVGFMDESQGSTIMVPMEWVAQTGSDFDIDSIYAIVREAYRDRKGNLKTFNYIEGEDDKSTRIRYANYVAEEYRALRKTYDNPRYSKEQFKEFIQDAGRKLLEADEIGIKALSKEINSLKDDIYLPAQRELPDDYKQWIYDYNASHKDAKFQQRINDQLEHFNNINNDNVLPQIKAYIAVLNDLAEKLQDMHDKYEGMYNAAAKQVIEELSEEDFKRVQNQASKIGAMSFDQFKTRSIADQNTLKANNGRILDCMINALSDPKSLEENLMVSGFDDLLDIRDGKINGVKYNYYEDPSRAARTPYDFMSQVRYQQEMMSGARLKAISVTMDTFCSVCNTVKPHINENHRVQVKYSKKQGYSYEQLKQSFNLIEGDENSSEWIVTHDTVGWSNNNRNSRGKLITAYSSQTTAHCLDVAKEGPVPNVNDITFQVYKLFPNIGSDYDTGVTFIMQEGITRIIDAYNESNSIYVQSGNYNYIHTAIKKLAVELGLGTEQTPINQIIKQFNDVYRKQIFELARRKDDGKYKFDITSNATSTPFIFDQERQIERLTRTGDFANETNCKLWDFITILQFNSLNNLGNQMSDLARLLNPDKGVKQTIYATNKVFDDINTILNDKNKVNTLYVVDEKNKITVPILQSVYPGIEQGIDHYMTQTGENSTYPSLHTFLKYSSATSIKVNQQLFVTQNANFRGIILGLQDVLNGQMTEKLYKDFEKYVLAKIFNNTSIISDNFVINENGDIVFNEYDESFEDIMKHDERSRIYGYSRTQEINFDVKDINNPTPLEVQKFSELSPAQMVKWIQENTDNGIIFDHLKTSLYNAKEYKKRGTCRQTISFNGEVQDIESLFWKFDQALTNSNPLIKLAALNLFKYAVVTEGFKMKRNGITKLITNDTLRLIYSKSNNVSFVDECNQAIADIESTIDRNSLYENYIRSHSTIKQIASKTNKFDKNLHRRQIITENNIIVFNINNPNHEELARDYGFISVDVNASAAYGRTVYKLGNKYLKLISGKNTTLYKIAYKSGYVIAYPLNLLEENENSEYSANVNNNIYNPQVYYENVAKNYIDSMISHKVIEETNGSQKIVTLSDVIKDNSEALNELKKAAEEFKISSVKQKIKVEININDKKHESLKKEILKHSDEDYFFVGSINLTYDVPYNQSTNPIVVNGKTYVLTHIDLKSYKDWIDPKGKHYKDKIKGNVDDKIVSYIQNARDSGYNISNLFRADLISVENLPTVQVSENDNVMLSAITEPTIKFTKVATKALEDSAIRGDKYALELVQSLKNDNITHVNIDSSTGDKALYSVKNYLQSFKRNLDATLNNHFVTDDAGIWVGINSVYVKDNFLPSMTMRNKVLTTLLEAERFIDSYQMLRNIPFDSNDPEIARVLKEIQKAIQDIENHPEIVTARQWVTNEKLKALSTDPRIQSDMIGVLDGYNTVGFLDSWIGDTMHAPMPIIQIVGKEVMTNIKAADYAARRRANQFIDSLRKLQDAAKAAGVEFDLNDFIDEDGNIIQKYNSKLVTDRDEHLKNIKEAETKFGKHSKEHIIANRNYEIWKTKHFNREFIPKFYWAKLNAQAELFGGDIYDENGNIVRNVPISDIGYAVYGEYLKINDLIQEARSHANGDYLDPVWEKQLDDAYFARTVLSSEVDALGNPKEDYPTGTDLINNKIASNKIKTFIETSKAINGAAYDRVAKDDFDVNLQHYLDVIAKFERPDSLGRPTKNKALYENDEDYIAAKHWVKIHAHHVVDDATFKQLMQAFSDLKENVKSGTPLPNYIKNIMAIAGASDEYGQFTADNDALVAQGLNLDDVISKVKQFQEAAYSNRVHDFDDAVLISNSSPHNDVYSEAFYKGMTVGTDKAKEYIAKVGEINEILRNVYHHDDKTVHTEELDTAELEKLAKLYNELDNIKPRLKSPAGTAVKAFIDANVDFVVNSKALSEQEGAAIRKKFEIRRTKSNAEANAWYSAWEKVNKNSDGSANERLYSYAMPKAAVYDHFLDKTKTKAKQTIASTVSFVPTVYYEHAFDEAYKNGNFDDWFEKNHVFNPYTHEYEPLRIWTKMQYNSTINVDFEPTALETVSTPNLAYLNTSYKNVADELLDSKYVTKELRDKFEGIDLSMLSHYKYGSSSEYDNIKYNNLNAYAKEARSLMYSTLLSLANTDRSKKYFAKGHMPYQHKSETDHDKEYWLNQGAKFIGINPDLKDSHSWTKTVSYNDDKIPDMPMMGELADHRSRPEKQIPKQLAGESDADYQARVDKINKENEIIRQENHDIHKEIMDKNWDKVLEQFILNAGHYNAVQDNKYLMYYALDLLKNMKVYSRTLGIEGFDVSNGENVMETPEQAIALWENYIRRIVFGQFKENNGTLTKAAAVAQNMSSAKYMTMNFTGGIANITLGTAQIAIETVAGEFFSKEDYLAAKRMYLGAAPGMLKNIYNDKADTLAEGLIKYFNVVDFEEMAGVEKDENLDEVMSRIRNAAYAPQTVGEHWMQNGALLSMLHSHRMYNGKLITFEQYSRGIEEESLLKVIDSDTTIYSNGKTMREMYDEFVAEINSDVNKKKDYVLFNKYYPNEFMMTNKFFNRNMKKQYAAEVKERKRNLKQDFASLKKGVTQFELRDGKVQVKSGSELSMLSQEQQDKLRAEFMYKVVYVNKLIHGVYDKLGGARLESKLGGNLVMQYHKHIHPGYVRRYRKDGYYSEMRENIQKGFSLSFMKFCLTPFNQLIKDLKLNEEGDRDTVQALQNLGRNMLEFYGDIALNYQILPENEKANARRNLITYMGTTLALLLGLMARLAWDDDDEGIGKNLYWHELDRFSSEVIMYTMYGTYSEFKKLYSTPMAFLSGVNDTTNAIGVAFQLLFNEDYNSTYTTGQYAGENKLKVLVTRQIPIYRSIDRLMRLDRNNKYYKLSQNMLGIIPIKDIAEYLKH